MYDIIHIILSNFGQSHTFLVCAHTFFCSVFVRKVCSSMRFWYLLFCFLFCAMDFGKSIDTVTNHYVIMGLHIKNLISYIRRTVWRKYE